jgi:two-component system, OmpR family, alkaline phosphatase synthesis response regulator PhoP
MVGKTILVVDDEQDILDLLAYNLRKEGFTVLTAPNGKAALELVEERYAAHSSHSSHSAAIPQTTSTDETHDPSDSHDIRDIDAIVLDIMMPELDGFQTCLALRANPRTAGIPVLFLTAKASEIDEILGLELGADDYIQKPISPRLLVTRIKAQVRRAQSRVQPEVKTEIKTETIAVPELLIVDALAINRQNYTVRIDGTEHFFPKKEFELLAFLAANPDKVFDREFLLRRIWGESVHVIERTVDVHISKIREKLGDHSSCIETVKGIGYRFTARSRAGNANNERD